MLTKRGILVVLGLLTSPAFAKLNVITTTEDLASLTRSIGGEWVEALALARGTQDPHFIEAKPSYIVKLSRADVVLAVGLQLETAWLSLLLRGARRPHLIPGQPGYLEVSQAITPLEIVPNADRADGDIHPFGNPHFMADPERGLQVAALIAKKLEELDPPHEAQFRAGYAAFEKMLKPKIADWKKRLAGFAGMKVLGYHRTFNYFFHFFDFKAVGYLEPKPGIPPTAQHIVKLVALAKAEKVRLIVVENYFDMKPALTAAEQTGAHTVALPAYTGGDAESPTYEAWLERLVSGVEKALK